MTTPDRILPRNDTEEKLATIWAQVLGLERVGVTDDFFELGGHSLLAVRLFNEIERQMDQKLPLATLFSAPTIERFANNFDNPKRHLREWTSLVEIQPLGIKPPLFLVHGAGGNVLLYRELARQLGDDQPIYGLQSPGLDGESQTMSSIEKMAAHYVREVRIVQPDGPYHLGGYCMGGTVAYEMARQLAEAGDEVGLLALLDTYNFSQMSPTSTFQILSQKFRFHLKNIAGLGVRDAGRYLREKVRIAREGELKNLLARRRASGAGDSRRLGGVSRRIPVTRVNEMAATAYFPLPYFGKVTVFKPKVNYGLYPDSDMGWKDLALGGIEIVELPVNPHAMLAYPFVSLLARELKKRISEGAGEKGSATDSTEAHASEENLARG